jgi:hypothetical protein
MKFRWILSDTVERHRTRGLFFLTALLLWVSTGIVAAQSDRFELAGKFVTHGQSEFDETDLGFGAQFGYRLTPNITLEAELSVFPGDLTDSAPFSASRLEGLFGVKAGRQWEKMGLFGKVRPGFLHYGAASEPLVCILIFPPPLSCSLASGGTSLAVDLGGVFELYPSPRSFVRVDVGDEMVRFNGPVLRTSGAEPSDAFMTHNFRFTIGVGTRF